MGKQSARYQVIAGESRERFFVVGAVGFGKTNFQRHPELAVELIAFAGPDGGYH
jgi:hypothetical protein